MIIESIQCKDFRNYESLDIKFDEGCNIIYGQNAQGKTNILEALYISGTTKSHKGSREKDMIRFGESEAHIKTTVRRDDRSDQIDIHLKKNSKKGIAINKVPIKKAAELFGYLPIIFFSPEDLGIIKNGPSERRRFIDSELCQIDRIYLYELTNYNKVLNQRNKLLKDISFNPSLRETLPVWDEQLIEHGRKIISARRDFIAEMAPIVRGIHRSISGGTEDPDIKYEPDVEDMFFADELIANRDRDLRFGQTSCGPHRDDVFFSIKDIDIRKFGSQGQQRTCALSLKLSEISVMERSLGQKPVLLLDDVMSELDSSRQNFLLDSLQDTQTIITCTGMDDLIKNRFPVSRIFHVESGTVSNKERIE